MEDDLAIARRTRLRPIAEIAARGGVPEDALSPHGRFKAKIDLEAMPASGGRMPGKLVLVTGISPTPAGEGKTTTTIGLGDALNAAGARAMICLRQPSLGPNFGQKGGATGGGRAQVAPMDEINLHFTGDFHAITSANNLLAAMADNHVYWGNALGLDTRRVTWRRALDMNDRALRRIVVGLGGAANGYAREDGFDITVASEVMAVFCLAEDLGDLRTRLGRMIVGRTRAGAALTVADLKADGAMTALLRDALQPNLVQTLEGSPALIHGGPFANIAHGCNSVAATRAGLALADIVVTEAGFGADLGAEKFIDIKCRQAALAASCAVLVASARALKMHGGVARATLAAEDVSAIRRGAANLRRHVENLGKFGLPVVVALNKFDTDTDAEIGAAREAATESGAEFALCTHWRDGAVGAADLATMVTRMLGRGETSRPLYADTLPLADKIRTVAREIYRADDVVLPAGVARDLARFEAEGFGALPVCIAKTQYSFTADPTRLGAPDGHVLPVREVRLSAGAGFVVVLCGEVMTMPGLPRVPAAERIGVDERGEIIGLF